MIRRRGDWDYRAEDRLGGGGYAQAYRCRNAAGALCIVTARRFPVAAGSRGYAGKPDFPVSRKAACTHEQFHSEIKSDLDLERLPSGKFDTNDAIVHLASFAYNCLRLLGQLGLTGEIAPIRHPAKRRRLKTVLQEIMYRAAKFVTHARKLILGFGRGVAAHANVFIALQERLLRVASP